MHACAHTQPHNHYCQPRARPQEEHISAALGPRYWLVASRSMYQTRLLVFARMDVAPFIWE